MARKYAQLSSATTDIECANVLLLRRSIWRDQARFRLFWGLLRHQLAGQLHSMKAAGLRAPRYLEWANFGLEILCIFSPLW